jgi:hypothetical protein
VVREPGGAINLSLLQRVQKGSGADPASWSIEAWNFHGIKPEHSVPPGAQVRKEWSCNSTPGVFLACVRTNVLALLLHFIYIARRM